MYLDVCTVFVVVWWYSLPATPCCVKSSTAVGLLSWSATPLFGCMPGWGAYQARAVREETLQGFVALPVQWPSTLQWTLASGLR